MKRALFELLLGCEAVQVELLTRRRGAEEIDHAVFARPPETGLKGIPAFAQLVLEKRGAYIDAGGERRRRPGIDKQLVRRGYVPEPAVLVGINHGGSVVQG